MFGQIILDKTIQFAFSSLIVNQTVDCQSADRCRMRFCIHLSRTALAYGPIYSIEPGCFRDWVLNLIDLGVLFNTWQDLEIAQSKRNISGSYPLTSHLFVTLLSLFLKLVCSRVSMAVCLLHVVLYRCISVQTLCHSQLRRMAKTVKKKDERRRNSVHSTPPVLVCPVSITATFTSHRDP